MEERKEKKKIDTKEFELPETTFVHDIENTVFQGIVLRCLSDIRGVSVMDGNIVDNILGRTDGIKSITADQDPDSRSISIKVEIKIDYGVSIPKKAEEIQTKITEVITDYTGLPVSSVHVIFKGLILPEEKEQFSKQIFDDQISSVTEYSELF